MPIKSVKMKISKNKKMRFFLMSQGSLNPKIRFLGQKMCSAARGRTDRQTDRHTRKCKQRTPFQVFRIFFQICLQPIIKERSKMIDSNIYLGYSHWQRHLCGTSYR